MGWGYRVYLRLRQDNDKVRRCTLPYYYSSSWFLYFRIMFSFALLAYHTRPTVKLLSGGGGTAAVTLTAGRFVDLLDQFFLTV